MKSLLFSIFSFTILFSVDAQQPVIKWWYDTDDMAFGNAAMADVDGDGLPEIAFSMYRNDERLVVLNAEDGSLLWEYNTGGCNDAAPLIYDVDMDGSLEIVLASSCVTKTFCFDAATGEIKWFVTTHGSDSPPTVGDVDNDGKPEILHGEFNGYIICINGEDGSVLWEFNADPNCWIQTAPTLLDADGDEQTDFVVANWSFGDDNKIFAFRGADHQLLWESDLPNDVIYHGASHADIDGDGLEELVIGDYSGMLYALNAEDGSLLWDFSFPSPTYIGSPTSIADLNNDSLFEIVFFDWYKVGCLSNEGTLLWDYSIPGYGSSFRGAAISDDNNDSINDVMFGTSTGALIALIGNTGSLLWTVDLQEHFGPDDFEIDHGPVITDFDNDGILDAFVVGGHSEYPAIENNYGRAYAVSLESHGGPGWPMFRYNPIRSACLIPDPVSTVVSENKISQVRLVYPNPCNGSFHLSSSLYQPSGLHLKIFDMTGRKVLDRHLTGRERKIEIPGKMRGIYVVMINEMNKPPEIVKLVVW